MEMTLLNEQPKKERKVKVGRELTARCAVREGWRVGWDSLAQLHKRLFWPNSKAIKAVRETNIRYQQRWRRWREKNKKKKGFL